MRIWFDTEFLDDGATIELISIGMVRSDGAELYIENGEFDWQTATPWLKQNVYGHLFADAPVMHRQEIAQAVLEFCGVKPDFWAYYSAYDWVVLCQLFGPMLNLPAKWPHICWDVRQLMKGNESRIVLPYNPRPHHALYDARWARDLWFLAVEAARTRAPDV